MRNAMPDDIDWDAVRRDLTRQTPCACGCESAPDCPDQLRGLHESNLPDEAVVSAEPTLAERKEPSMEKPLSKTKVPTAGEVKPLLAVCLHLMDGSQQKLTVNDPAAARMILDQVRNGRVFGQTSLIINIAQEVIVCPGAALARIDVDMDTFPDDVLQPTHHTNVEVSEITETEWRSRYRPDVDHTAERKAVRKGDPIVVFSEIHLANGTRFFIEAHLLAPTIQEDRNFLHNLFARPGIFCRRRGGGITIWNWSRVVSCTFYPGPPGVPATAWPVDTAAKLEPFEVACGATVPKSSV